MRSSSTPSVRLLLLAPAYYYRGTGLITLLTLGVLGSKFLSKIVGFPPFRPVGLFIDGPWLMFAMGVFVFWVIHHRTEQRRKAMGITFLLGGLLVTAQVLKPQLYNYLFVYSVSVVFTLLLLILQPYDRASVEPPTRQDVGMDGGVQLQPLSGAFADHGTLRALVLDAWGPRGSGLTCSSCSRSRPPSRWC